MKIPKQRIKQATSERKSYFIYSLLSTICWANDRRDEASYSKCIIFNYTTQL